MRIHSLAAVVALLACSSTHNTGGNALTTSGGGGMCAALAGSYSITFRTRSGNCGDIPEQIINVDSNMTRTQVAQCSISSTVSSDKCTVSYDQTCPVPSTGGTVREEGTAHASADGSMLGGTEQITLFNANGTLACSGTYDLSYTRL